MKNIEDLNSCEIDYFYKKIGKNVKRKRKECGVTQLQLSQALGHKSVGLVSQAELYHNGQHFNIKHLYQIAHILECDINEFFT